MFPLAPTVGPITRACLLLLLALAITACSFQTRQINALADGLENRGVANTLAIMETVDPPKRDRAQYLLNLGILKRLNGDLAGSNRDLQEAKEIIASLQAISISENAGALTINETLRSYAGSPSDQVLLHELMAYNYLNEEDLDSARVEMLQADITMRQLASGDSLSGQLASAHYLTGVIYELGGEWDNAMISYRKALDIVDERQQSVPRALADSLLQTSLRQQLKPEYQRYVSRFGRETTPFAEGDSELLVFYSDGRAIIKQQHFISLWSIEASQFLSVALPYYPTSHYTPRYLSFNVAGRRVSTRPIENIDSLAREDLSAEMPAITATALARAVTKYQSVRQAQQQDNMAGLLLNIANTLTESADMRSWNMLPASLQIARIRIPADTIVEYSNHSGKLAKAQAIPFDNGKKLLLFASSLTRLDSAAIVGDSNAVETVPAASAPVAEPSASEKETADEQ